MVVSLCLIPEVVHPVGTQKFPKIRPYYNTALTTTCAQKWVIEE